MFYPKEMCSVTVAAHRKHLKPVIEALYDSRVLHLKEHVPEGEKDFSIGSPLENAERISSLLLSLQSAKSLLDLKGIVPKKQAEMGKAEKFLSGLKEEVSRLETERKALDDSLKRMKKDKEMLDFLRSAGIGSLSFLDGFESVRHVAGFVTDVEVLKKREKELDMTVFSGEKTNRYPVVIFFRKEREGDVRALLQESEFSGFEISIGPGGTVSSRIKEMDSRESEIRRQLQNLSGKMKALSSSRGPELLAYEAKLNEEIMKSEAPLKFGMTNDTFVVQGWLPFERSRGLEQRLGGVTDNLYLNIEKTDHQEAPTLLENKGPVKPFEFFLRLYSLPKNNEIDPTFLMFMSFPILFGMMLGDIGYGIVLLAGFIVIKFRMGKLRSLSSVLIISALVTIAFGVLFGEFFGAEQIMGQELHPYLNRIHGVNELLILSIVVGLVHINIGIIFGFINELKHYGPRRAFGKVSWFMLEAGGILLILLNYKIITVNPVIGYVLVAASVIGLAVSEGFIGIIEIPSLISNILSYARLAAVGIASASLAILVNEMAGSFFHMGGAFLALGVGILFLGHAINTMLGLMDCFLQSLRLHYVEMFTKFYHGSGEPYRPFGS